MQLPEDFREQMLLQLGTAEAESLFAALDAEPPVSIRINARKGQGGEGDPVPWCATGRYLPRRPQFTLDPLLHAGCYYVQEASSMAVEQAYRVLKRR
ncbi:MAG: rRNA cytosine-C5-methyltransferase, partial [Alloprevotella sp.]|nr:rRNA cytosine-C5-methyltransferase [Alloprevotella sp.]